MVKDAPVIAGSEDGEPLVVDDDGRAVPEAHTGAMVGSGCNCDTRGLHADFDQQFTQFQLNMNSVKDDVSQLRASIHALSLESKAELESRLSKLRQDQTDDRQATETKIAALVS